MCSITCLWIEIPVWMMRQAGRTDPEYCQLRKNDGRALENLFLDPETAIKISLLPKRLGVDAIIMFQDILTPLTQWEQVSILLRVRFWKDQFVLWLR